MMPLYGGIIGHIRLLKYLDRLDEMNRASGSKKNKRDEEVLRLFYQISL
jgi:hypothetical protein